MTPQMAVAAIKSLQSFDVVHSFNFITFQSLVGSMMKVIGGVPHVLTVSYHHWAPRYDETVGGWIMKTADALIAQCQQEKESISKYAEPQKIEVVPCGIDPADFTNLPDEAESRSGLNQLDKTMLYVGPLSGHKSIGELLGILPRIVARVPGARLVVVGGGSRKDELASLARNLGVEGHVSFLGRIGEEELRKAYARADVFVFPSKHESFGIALLEAGAAGIPIVTTPVGVAPEIVQQGENGFLCANCDEEFADKIVRVLGDDGFRADAMERRKQILREYDWEKVVNRLEALYARVLR